MQIVTSDIGHRILVNSMEIVRNRGGRRGARRGRAARGWYGEKRYDRLGEDVRTERRGGAGSADWRVRTEDRGADEPCEEDTTSDRGVEGTCTAMCSTEEVRERQRTKDISRFEYPREVPRTEPSWAVKKYRRPAAGRIEMNARELRPPHVLATTLRHLFDTVLPWPGCGFDWEMRGDRSSGSAMTLPPPAVQHDFLALYHFVSDRVRSVRQDLVIQRVQGAARVSSLMHAARFYVLSSFCALRLLDTNDKMVDWSDTLNDQQLASALTEVHAQLQAEDSNEHSVWMLHEEALVYDMLLHLHDPHAVSMLLLKTPRRLLQASRVRLAMRLFLAIQTGDYHTFKSLSRQLPVLQKCLLLRHLPLFWVATLQAMNKAYGKIDRFSLHEISETVDLPSSEDARRLCVALNIRVDDDESLALASTVPADSWEDNSNVSVSGSNPQISSGFVKFKITAMAAELSADVARELTRRKAASIQATLVAPRYTASQLVMTVTEEPKM